MSDEDEYFRRLDQEAKAKLKAKLDREHAEADRVARIALHHHKCGKCGASMTTRAFRGIEIEMCDECGAVLLDPGELEALAGQDGSEMFGSFFSMFRSGKTEG